jgi:NADH-quinone oxidoreductase subunit J
LAVELLVFWVFAPISVGAAVLMILSRNAIHSALFLVVNFFTIAVFYLLLGSPFLFVVQIVVYAGAIMVLFLFVIMLLGVDRKESTLERIRGQRGLALILGVGIAAEITTAVIAASHMGSAIWAAPMSNASFATVNAGGNAKALARVLFTRYFFPFEVTSVLLIVAAIAAMVLAKRRSVAERLAGGYDAEVPAGEPDPGAAPGSVPGTSTQAEVVA